MSNYPFVNVTGFTPNLGAWTSLANVAGLTRHGNQFTLPMSSGPGPLLTFLTPSMNFFDMTFFNYDNFTYVNGNIPSGEQPGPLNPAEPLYCSVPFFIETNPQPANGARYSYGIFFDNPAQSYANIGASDYSNMFGKYYF